MSIGILIAIAIEAGILAQYLSGWSIWDAVGFWFVMLVLLGDIHSGRVDPEQRISIH